MLVGQRVGRIAFRERTHGVDFRLKIFAGRSIMCLRKKSETRRDIEWLGCDVCFTSHYQGKAGICAYRTAEIAQGGNLRAPLTANP